MLASALGEVGAIINETDRPTVDILEEAGRQHPLLSSEFAALVTWTTDTRGIGSGRNGGVLDRDRFISPNNPYEQMEVAYDAADDDAVSGWLDASEALAFRRMGITCDDEDEEDIWAQIMDGIEIEDRMREIWREMNIVSQCTVAAWYGKRSFTVRGKTGAGTKRKKTYNDLTVPIGLTVLDPLKVVPCGSFLFQQEQLAYYADPTERDVIDSWLVGDDDSGADAIIQRLIVAKYEPDYRDRKQLGNFGVDPNRLYLLNPKYVWQHTATKPGYSRFAPIRMKTIFKLLDLKHQLQAMDRAHLIGATNFILLIKKGTDNLPAHQAEITSLQAQAKTISKVPVIVGDHRLSLEIITPKTDHTLLPTRYDLIDTRIASRLWGMFVTGAERDDSVKLVKVVAQGLESRRNSQRRKLMKHLIMPTFKINNQLQERPELMFSPRRIALDFDPTMSTYLLDLRDRGDLSRSSILSEVDYDEADEAAKRKMEKEKYDDIFEPPSSQVPVPAPGQIVEPGPVVAPVVPGAPNDPKRAGRSLGGNHGRGGNGSAGRGAGVPPAPGKTPNPKTGTSKPNPDGE